MKVTYFPASDIFTAYPAPGGKGTSVTFEQVTIEVRNWKVLCGLKSSDFYTLDFLYALRAEGMRRKEAVHGWLE